MSQKLIDRCASKLTVRVTTKRKYASETCESTKSKNAGPREHSKTERAPVVRVVWPLGQARQEDLPMEGL
jgi:hypothetical protein